MILNFCKIMQAKKDGSRKQKRQIKAPYKKWTKSEQESLINFLRDNKPIEKPTAQAYYKRYIGAKKLDWNVIRNKVRNMRNSYQKVVDWQNSTGAGALEKGQTINDVIRKKCPFFFDYEEVFGYKEPYLNDVILDTEIAELHPCLNEVIKLEQSVSPSPTENANDLLEFDSISNNTSDTTILIDTSPANLENTESSQDIPNMCDGAAIPTKNRKGIYSRPALSDIMLVQAQIIEMKKERNNAEIQLKEKELQLKKEMFSFEKESRSEELKLKKMEIESNEKIRILEIEMKERVAKMELEIKKEIEIEKLRRSI